MKKYKLDCFFVVYKFPFHKEMKESILELINEQPNETLQVTDDYYGDNITKLDWSRATDITRPWTQYFYPRFKETLDKITHHCGYQTAKVNDLWFQQYYNQDRHGWHIHGSNLTGVYYLELPADVPKTQLVDPFTQSEIIIPEIEEGDFLVFPSIVVHRAPPNNSNLRKTIISWNWDFDLIRPEVLDKINNTSRN